jgi:hypothetical protein
LYNTLELSDSFDFANMHTVFAYMNHQQKQAVATSKPVVIKRSMLV